MSRRPLHLPTRLEEHGVHFVVDPEGPGSSLLGPEWLVTNGLGGYASGTVSGIITRRFHGLLVAALPGPEGRTMMLNHLREVLSVTGEEWYQLGMQEPPAEAGSPVPLAQLAGFALDQGLPVWRYAAGDHVVERRVLMPHGQNTTHVVYRLLEGDGPLALRLEPYLHFRSHDGSLEGPLETTYSLQATDEYYEIREASGRFPALRLAIEGDCSLSIEGRRLQSVRYHLEHSRGYDSSGDLYSPGSFSATLTAQHDVVFLATTEPWHVASALSSAELTRCERHRRTRLLARARRHLSALPGEDPDQDLTAELVLAADQFVIRPTGRVRDAVRATASGEDVRTIIAGYHWFTDWGRDTMISLEGLTLVTGRHAEARFILRTFAHCVRDGLIPNMFPEGENDGLYHTADATLWYFHALHRYLAVTGDRSLLRQLHPQLTEILERHLQGTRFGIEVDPSDGLLTQGQSGYQLTWMDAKVGDLVVTPRRGKAVELNGLFYNALCLYADWTADLVGESAARPWREHAERNRRSFNARFWNPERGYLYDVVDGEDGGDDDALRPNQLFAFSLDHPVLDQDRWASVLEAVRRALLTPVGLRSLAPDHGDYKSKYFGDLRARDLAYHQGTVWGWLLGPYVDALLKVSPGARAEARSLVERMMEVHLNEGCVGSLSEIFDAEEPFHPRGCIAQAWSVAELLRGLALTQ
jgi:predicted glycogen debranching enzyme